MFNSQNTTPPVSAQPAPIDANALPVRVTVVNPDFVCPFNHNFFKKFPVQTGDVIMLTSKVSGDWYNYHTLDTLGSGKPNGMAYIKAFVAEAK